LLAFYRKLGMQGGGFNILFVKDPDYFRFLDCESATHAVGIVEDDEGTVEGMFAFGARPCYVAGKLERVVHVSDLRFTSRRLRKSKFDWKAVAGELCEQLPTIGEFKGARYLLGSFVVANEKARKAIASQKAPFDISPLSSYKMVNLLARKPLKWAGLKGKKRDPSVQVSRGGAADREDLRRFLDRQNRRRALGYVFEGPEDELARRLRVWDGFTMESFFIARDGNGQGGILGCFAAWDLSPARRIVVDRFPPGLAAAAAVIRPLAKKIPRPGEALRILYLTTQELDLDLPAARRGAVFAALLEALYESGVAADFHMVAVCDYDRESLLAELEPNYFTTQTATLLYQLYRRGDTNVLREQDLPCHVGHEMCLT
ncbi:MAG TPA: FAD-dependent oxidoreductase, partial [Polyangia bacterium]